MHCLHWIASCVLIPTAPYCPQDGNRNRSIFLTNNSMLSTSANHVIGHSLRNLRYKMSTVVLQNSFAWWKLTTTRYILFYSWADIGHILSSWCVSFSVHWNLVKYFVTTKLGKIFCNTGHSTVHSTYSLHLKVPSSASHLLPFSVLGLSICRANCEISRMVPCLIFHAQDQKPSA